LICLLLRLLATVGRAINATRDFQFQQVFDGPVRALVLVVAVPSYPLPSRAVAVADAIMLLDQDFEAAAGLVSLAPVGAYN
jgi:hypothetical protein